MDETVEDQKMNLWMGFKRAFIIDYRTLALFRVLIAGIVLVDLLFRSQHFVAFFSDQGVLPRRVVASWFGDATYSIYFINGGTLFTSCVIIIAVLAALCLALGYKTRLATFVTWFLVLSLQHRTSLLSSGADDLMRLLLFWAMFLPLGARYSIDSALEKNEPYPEKGHFSLATFAILMQALYVYWVGALLKSHDSWQVDYSAVYFSLNLEDYATFLGLWVADTFASLLPFITGFVLYLELLGPLFMVSPVLLLWFRTPALVMLIMMHIGFVILLNVGHFPYVSICSLLLFIPKEYWDRLAKMRIFNRDKGVTVFYDETCDFCLKTVKLIQHLCLLSNIKVLPAQADELAGPLLKKHDSWVIQKENGDTVLEWSALAYLVSLSPLLFWLSWPLKLMVKLGFGNAVYHFIGNRRVALGRVTEKFMPWRESSGKSNKFATGFVLICLCFCFYINIYSLNSHIMPKDTGVVLHAKRMLGLWQRWSMFAPRPLNQTRWPIFEATAHSGQKVDIFRHKEGPAPTAKPDHVLQDYSYYRWRKYFSRIYEKRYSHLRKYYVKYECKKWNEGKSHHNRIKEISLKMGIERTLPNQQKEAVEIRKMGTYRCK